MMPLCLCVRVCVFIRGPFVKPPCLKEDKRGRLPVGERSVHVCDCSRARVCVCVCLNSAILLVK